MLYIKNKINFTSETSGIDTFEKCLDKKHFVNYKKDIFYKYNSKGFRDNEWPKNLKNAIWCVGDSFTVGIGQPFEETWPQQLSKITGKKCINIGQDGCSNDYIAKRVNYIWRTYQPKHIIVMWSYLHRRKNLHYLKSDFGTKEDFANLVKNYSKVAKIPTNILHYIIPNGSLTDPTRFKYFCKKHNLEIKQIKQMDFARDYHHFDIKTVKNICNHMAKNI